MATATDFNLEAGKKAARKLLVTAVNVGSAETPEWEVIGAGIEDSSIEYNPELETVTDIVGVTETTVKKTEPKQSFEPYTIRGGSKLAFKIRKCLREQKLTELSMFQVMIIEGYVGSTGAYEAEIHNNCTIVANSIGGSSNVDMPIEINFSNDKKLGTVDKLKGDIKFTETAITE